MYEELPCKSLYFSNLNICLVLCLYFEMSDRESIANLRRISCRKIHTRTTKALSERMLRAILLTPPQHLSNPRTCIFSEKPLVAKPGSAEQSFPALPLSSS